MAEGGKWVARHGAGEAGCGNGPCALRWALAVCWLRRGGKKWAAVLGLGASRCAGLLHFASWATGLGKRGRGKGLGLGVELAWADGLGWEEGLRVGLLTGLGWVGYWAVSFLFSIFQPH